MPKILNKIYETIEMNNKTRLLKKLYLICVLVIFVFLSDFSNAQETSNNWPVLKTYDQEHALRIAMPVGGIGTGTVSLTGYGALQDWEIMSRPAKGYNPIFGKVGVIQRAPFFALYVNEKDKDAQAVLLEGPLPERYSESFYGAVGPNHGLPRFSEASFKTAYPFGQVQLRDKELPVEVTVGAFNPLLPGNTEDSSLPIAVLSYKIKNTSTKPITIAVAGNIPNFIGDDGKEGKTKSNRNTYKEAHGLRGLQYTSDSIATTSFQYGTFSLLTNSKEEISYRTNWAPAIDWGMSTLDYWDDLTDDGRLEERPNSGVDNPMGSLVVKTTLGPQEEKDIRFFVTWSFPNRQAWGKSKANIGNYYATKYKDSWDVAQKTIPRIPELEASTKQFVETFISSEVPEIIKEAALFNMSHFRTQLAFKTKEGHYLGWEGTKDNDGSGAGSCTHVWNYEQTIPFLFGDVAKNMREVEFAYATDKNGLMSYRIHTPLAECAQDFGLAAADGQMGSIMKFYREWQLSGDDEFLKTHWPMVKKALEFSWVPGGWDADKNGVMEGAQHNTMDVEYYGPNPQMGFWYLGALKVTAEMASYLGEKQFAKTCNSLDQLVGQVMAHILDLGYLAKEEHIKKTNEAIIKYNYRESLMKHPNFMRSYAHGNEAALVMAAYPKERPEKPFPYFTEVMTGFEHTAAISMLYENQTESGLNTIANVRARYDGKKRNPFNEAEYGNHYARSMVAWGGYLAVTNFYYSAVKQHMQFTSKNGSYFWSNGYQYGAIKIDGTDKEKTVAITAKQGGGFTLNSFKLHNFGSIKFKNVKKIIEGETVRFTIPKK